MKLLRAETLDRCHFKRNVEGGHYYVCEEHEFEHVNKTKQLKWKGESFCYTYKLFLVVRCHQLCLGPLLSDGYSLLQREISCLQLVLLLLLLQLLLLVSFVVLRLTDMYTFLVDRMSRAFRMCSRRAFLFLF
jgi:hypothetical protein